jgi:hypothetical protein
MWGRPRGRPPGVLSHLAFYKATTPSLGPRRLVKAPSRPTLSPKGEREEWVWKDEREMITLPSVAAVTEGLGVRGSEKSASSASTRDGTLASPHA